MCPRRGFVSFRRQKKNSTTTSTKKSTKQADAFSLPDDENENNDDDSEFVYEKITLLTADGVVVLPGRKLRRSSLEGGSPSVRARWRREAEERRRKEQREARRRPRPRLQPFPSRHPRLGGEGGGGVGAGGDASGDLGSRVCRLCGFSLCWRGRSFLSPSLFFFRFGTARLREPVRRFGEQRRRPRVRFCVYVAALVLLMRGGKGRR